MNNERRNINYVLGAGFSAPLGLPVMSNFLMKSKDLYFNNISKYQNFKTVFKEVEKMSYVKNFYQSDLFNIEEILSIIEMNNLTTGNQGKADFINYIIDVIEGYTPKVSSKGIRTCSNWYDNVFETKLNNLYGNFVLELLNLKFFTNNNSIIAERKKEINTNYSIISLNYDCVIENYINLFNQNHLSNTKIVSGIDFSENVDYSKFNFAKLHGCVKQKNIIPPTWSKSSKSDIIKTWILARKLLESATQIRILGFSLPDTDSYLKYLFKSSVLKSKNLKKIDVINLDNSNASKMRYDNFINFNYYIYKNGDIIDYFKINHKLFKTQYDSYYEPGDWKIKDLNLLEEAHKIFIQS